MKSNYMVNEETGRVLVYDETLMRSKPRYRRLSQEEMRQWQDREQVIKSRRAQEKELAALAEMPEPAATAPEPHTEQGPAEVPDQDILFMSRDKMIETAAQLGVDIDPKSKKDVIAKTLLQAIKDGKLNS